MNASNNQTDDTQVSRHDWFAERIAVALAGGLSGAEKDRFNAHAHDCSACAAALADATAAEASLTMALADLQPRAGLEDRIIKRRPSRYPMIYRATAAVAATLVVGAVGSSILLPSLNRARETANGVKLANAQRQIDMLESQQDGQSTPAPMASTPPAGDATGLPADKAKDLQTPAPRADVPVLSMGEGAASSSYLKVQQQLDDQSPAATIAASQRLAFDREGNRSAEFGVNLFSGKMPQDNLIEQSSRASRGAVGGGGFGGSGFGGGGFAARNGVRPMVADASGYKDVLVSPAASPAAPSPVTDTATDTASEIFPTTQPSALSSRKIIRTGEMTFEVESFDAAYARLSAIVRESGGYVGSTDSQRLPNGKVRGAVTLRVPPENLDVLVLKLRGLGDLKQQRIGAQDITRDYTDLQSQLRAAQAMQDRLLELIHTANGQVKDLLAVEKELGVWRQKVEEVTGQINYYNNLVSLSTLQVTLSEKDIGQAAVTIETQTVNAGLEADDVSHAREEVFKAVAAAKGRILQSAMNEEEAGQFTATVIASIPPDAAGGVIDRLHQLGHVARLESSRQQSVAPNATAPDSVSPDSVSPGLRIERRDTVLNLSIYNVAAYAARTSDNLSVGCDDVESAYHALLNFVAKSDGGLVVRSTLTRPRPDATTGNITFEVRESSADAVLTYLRTVGTVLQLNVSENQESVGVTSSKRAFYVILLPLSAIAPQETDEITLLPRGGDLQTAYAALLDFAAQPASGARVLDKNLQQENGVFTSASIDMEVSRRTLNDANAAIAAAGKIINHRAARQPDSTDVLDTKVLLKFSFVNVAALEPRQTIQSDISAADAAGAYQAILDVAKAADATIRSAQLNVQTGQSVGGEMEFDLPSDKQAVMEQAIDSAGVVMNRAATRAAENDATTDSRVRMHLRFTAFDQLAPRRTFSIQVQTSNPQAASAEMISAALAAGGKVIQHSASTDPSGQITASLVLLTPLSHADEIATQAAGKGTIDQNQSTEDPQAPGGPAARARLEIQFASQPALVGDDNGLAATIRGGWITSIRGLLWSLEALVIGLCLLGPWAVIAWISWRLFRRARDGKGTKAPRHGGT